eukprot:m.117235 g.117235  ORF g.117235 m.117235 type:complete len:956 (+) comp16093_c0_seq2:74-2941(+)
MGACPSKENKTSAPSDASAAAPAQPVEAVTATDAAAATVTKQPSVQVDLGSTAQPTDADGASGEAKEEKVAEEAAAAAKEAVVAAALDAGYELATAPTSEDAEKKADAETKDSEEAKEGGKEEKADDKDDSDESEEKERTHKSAQAALRAKKSIRSYTPSQPSVAGEVPLSVEDMKQRQKAAAMAFMNKALEMKKVQATPEQQQSQQAIEVVSVEETVEDADLDDELRDEFDALDCALKREMQPNNTLKRITMKIASEAAQKTKSPMHLDQSGDIADTATSTVSLEQAESSTKEVWAAIDQMLKFPRGGRVSKEAVQHTGWKTIHVYISGTASDLAVEHQAIMTKAMTELQTWAATQHLNIVPVNVEYGMPSDQSTVMHLQTAMQELERCSAAHPRPLFIALLGSKYGAIPKTERVPQQFFTKYNWIPNTSVRHSEIMQGAFFNKNENAAFFIRDEASLESAPADVRSKCQENDLLGKHGMDRLKERVRARFPTQCFDYKVKWDQKTADASELIDGVVKFLKAAITKSYEFKVTAPTAAFVAGRDHNAFKNSVTACIGREAEMEIITKYVRRMGAAPPLLLRYADGAGVSHFLASAANKLAEGPAHSAARVVLHNTSVNRSAATMEALLERIIFELGNGDQIDAVKNKQHSTHEAWEQAAATVLAKCDIPCKTVLMVDGAHRLTWADGKPATRNWIPSVRPARLRIVISAEDTTSSLNVWSASKLNAPSGEVTIETSPFPALAVETRKKLVTEWTAQNPAVLPTATKLCDSISNLHTLKALTTSLVTFNDNKSLGITSMSALVEARINTLDTELATWTSAELHLGRQTLAFLCMARGGLNEWELLSLLGRTHTSGTMLPTFMYSKIMTHLSPLLKVECDRFKLASEEVAQFVYQQVLDKEPPFERKTVQALLSFFETAGDAVRAQDEIQYHKAQAEMKKVCSPAPAGPRSTLLKA